MENDRPAVVPLDDRSISAVFRDEQLGAFLILQEADKNKEAIFLEAALKWRERKGSQNIIFIRLPVFIVLFRKSMKISMVCLNI